MGRSYRIGSARGVAILVHPSFAILLLWVTYQWGITAGAGVRGVIFGTLVLLSVFGCVILHELAHAVTAMHHGLRVRDITLLPIGGVARVEHTPLPPRAEMAIALAGPVMNILIAAALTPLVILIAAARQFDHPLSVVLYADDISPAGFLLYLWIANLLLAIFNLIPAFPMDGGRVLRAGIALFRGRLAATRIAVGIGYIFAVLLTIVGLWAGDFLMPLVSVFILVAAHTETRHVEMESALRALPVGQFALWEAGGVRPDEPLAQAMRGGPRDVSVTQDGVVVGMLWRNELLKHLNGAHRELLVRDVMDRRFNAVEATDSVFDVHLWLTSTSRPAVPVVEQGQYRGIFTLERLAHVHAHLGGRAGRRRRDRMQLLMSRLSFSRR